MSNGARLQTRISATKRFSAKLQRSFGFQKLFITRPQALPAHKQGALQSFVYVKWGTSANTYIRNEEIFGKTAKVLWIPKIIYNTPFGAK
jgi:hypothetical protein